MHELTRILIAIVLLSTVLAGAGSGQSASPTPEPPRPASPPPTGSGPKDSSWLKSASAAGTVSLTLAITRPAASPSATINGMRAGEARIVVPLRWTVKWDWRNDDASGPHSLVVMTQREKIPLEGGRAAFSNGMTRMIIDGLAPGQTDHTTFEADEAGWYWLMCGVPSHALNGEWLELRVSPDAQTAGLELKPR